MKTPIHRKTLLFAFLVVFLITASCEASSAIPFLATATPYPTYTPLPTFTPLPPTATPVPERWSMKVISAVKAQKFGEWFFEEGGPASEFILLTVEYTYHGDVAIDFYPMSVELLFPQGSYFPGLALAAGYYQPENSIVVMNFANAPVLTTIKPGQTKVEKFGWAIFSHGDTRFVLLFPEADPVEINVTK